MIIRLFKRIYLRSKWIVLKVKYMKYNHLYHNTDSPIDNFFREKRNKLDDEIYKITNELVGLKYGGEYVQWKLKQGQDNGTESD